MGKLSKKLIIYLDQNFISEIAKVDIVEKVSKDYKKIFDLIHKGFIEEKIIVPRCFFQEVETHMLQRFGERIGKYQSYMGQVSLRDEYDVEKFQIISASESFLRQHSESIDWSFVYKANPDSRLEQFDIKIKDDELIELFAQDSDQKARALREIQYNIKKNSIFFQTQFQFEMEAIKDYFLRFNTDWISRLFRDDSEMIKNFVNSKNFEVPKYTIYARMWTQLLVSHNHRPIKQQDLMDINIISTYLPYVDVFVTDSFMDHTIRELKLDGEYKTKIFSSEETKRKEFIEFLEEYLKTNNPVNVPDVSIFVFSDYKIKKNSFDFFRKLGSMTLNDQNGWLELYAFDDGEMPDYTGMPFYGLADVKVIKYPKGADIIEECKKYCRSEKFIFIDSYRKIPENFKETAVEYCWEGKNKVLGYAIHSV